MSSAVNTIPPSNKDSRPQPSVPWLSIVWFAGLLILCYAPVLIRLVRQWESDEDMGHGFFVPLVAGYIAWQQRGQLLSAPLRPNYWGLALVLFAAMQLLVSQLGAELFLARIAFILSITGAVLLLGGTRAIQVLAFPLCLLLFMVPIPAIVYGQITLPLQLLASSLAESALSLVGIPVLRDGNVLQLPSQSLNVVEACSGIRSLLSLSFLALVYAYFFDSKTWMRWLLLILTVPIAILANAARVTLSGVLGEYRTEWSHGIYHSVSGWIVFMVALGMLVIVHRVINAFYEARHTPAPAVSD
jgi:exosortase